ncbi:DUF6898 family protein [Phenylobacterium montanum]|uniref:DUF6898 domain-containing protein n=1 Tax=Phenylobacterium montanum TaxID=2823693 RepID=A0A975ITE9_9CAUL|nr:hypothetical protein [Caulobacter sp. S6]QUD86718.1 hypothetical protein KCG34_16760 [Caulobacter sp. S6]
MAAIPPPTGEILFELRPIGRSVKVSAIHVDTGTEVSLAGPISAGEHVLKQMALNKLAYVLASRKG